MIIAKFVFEIVIASIMCTFCNLKISDFPENKEYCCLVAKLCATSMPQWTVAHQAPLSVGFVGCHFLLQQIFLTQGLNPGFPHCKQTLYHLSHQGSP